MLLAWMVFAAAMVAGGPPPSLDIPSVTTMAMRGIPSSDGRAPYSTLNSLRRVFSAAGVLVPPSEYRMLAIARSKVSLVWYVLR